MKPQITGKMDWLEIDGPEGIKFMGGALAGDVYPEYFTVESCRGYGARLSMPGFLDCTEWTVYDTAQEAAGGLISMYFDYADDELTEEDRGYLESLQEIEANGL